MKVTIRRADIEELIDLRHRMLRRGLPREAAYFDGDDAATTIHLAAVHEGNIIGCATILQNAFDGRPASQLRGMAVDETWHGHGVGRQLLEEVHRIATDAGMKLIWANARVPAAEFYRRCGWEIVSEQFEIPTAGPHYKMVRRL